MRDFPRRSGKAHEHRTALGLSAAAFKARRTGRLGAHGEAAGWTVVGRHGRKKFALQPVPIRRGMMVSLSRTSD